MYRFVAYPMTLEASGGFFRLQLQLEENQSKSGVLMTAMNCRMNSVICGQG